MTNSATDRQPREPVRLSLAVSPELNEKLEALAAQSYSTKSDVLRRAIALLDVAQDAKSKQKKLAILNQDRSVDAEIVGI
jgi:predicted transcriptional regulator